MNGFMHAEGRKIVDGNGNEILLKGWGLGNWLLQEGYMWEAGGLQRFDRPRRIEQVIKELTGKEYAEAFWKKFRENYVRREDILYMARLGYNSVRIPVNWRILMEEGEKLAWKEEGFLLLDRCISWCEEAGIYVFLDLHGAPGGQTGANIDDCVDDVPRLFTDSWAWEKGLAIWEKLAERYANEKYVGGYDLLNEPIAPYEGEEKNYDYLAPKLIEFYKEAIKKIRSRDKVHMISLEGMHWATETGIFTERLDDNMVLHFHRYAEPPQRKCLDTFIKKAEELQVPLWMGETGENKNEWYAALYPMALSLGIGYNLWPWKKMNCTNSPCSVKKPDGYEKIISYIAGGSHPGFKTAQKIFDKYLDNILLENCELHEEVTNHVLRIPPFALLAVDFDEAPGTGASYGKIAGGIDTEKLLEEPKMPQFPRSDYRHDTGMEIVKTEPEHEKEFVFDCLWDNLGIILEKDEFVTYSLKKCERMKMTVELIPGFCGTLAVEAGSREDGTKGVAEVTYLEKTEIKVSAQDTKCNVVLEGKDIFRVRIYASQGRLCLKKIIWN